MAQSDVLRAALVQINTIVGDLPANRKLILDAYRRAIDAGASLVIYPELTFTGYPPEDLLLKPSFSDDTLSSLQKLLPEIQTGVVIVGLTDPCPGGMANGAAIIANGQVRDIYHKCTLPNYGVFDEKRYFQAGSRCPVYEIGPWRIAVNICEDLWVRGGVPKIQVTEGEANLMVNLSASPYWARKGTYREELFRSIARIYQIPILHINQAGGQDELVFDGQSMAVSDSGEILARGPQFESHLMLVDLPAPMESSSVKTSDTPSIKAGTPIDFTAYPLIDSLPDPHFDKALKIDFPALDLPPAILSAPALVDLPAGSTTLNFVHEILGEEEEIYAALITGLRDYVSKNGFGGVVIGLSGGIDSALTAMIAVDALGADAVVGVSMPTEFSSASSRQGAADLARNLSCQFHEIPISCLFEHMITDLKEPLLKDDPFDVTEENIQARLRGAILMAFSNRLGHLVLATGNKSEIAVGYCTLYGDMVGGYAVLKDLLKTEVYRLSRWRNEQSPDSPPIPEDTIIRPPSAELRPDQKDSDSLPKYDQLDPIITALVELEQSPREIIAAGYDKETVNHIFGLIQGNEYKRRQGAPGIKITPRAFGRDRRYPLTNRYRPGES